MAKIFSEGIDSIVVSTVDTEVKWFVSLHVCKHCQMEDDGALTGRMADRHSLSTWRPPFVQLLHGDV